MTLKEQSSKASTRVGGNQLNRTTQNRNSPPLGNTAWKWKVGEMNLEADFPEVECRLEKL